ncbi:MAG TPA: hypothetical protein VF894_03655 [Anaeromyxobacter sp.]
MLCAATAAAAAPAGKPVTRSSVPAVRAGDPSPDRPVVRLVTADDASRLCHALEPSERLRTRGDAVERGEAETAHDAAREAAIVTRYEVVVSAAGLAFAPYDGPERRLALAEPVQVPFAEGTARLWPTEERGLPVELDAAGARRVLEAQRVGALALALVFDLPDDAACGTGARGKKLTLGVEPVSWRWVEGDKVLARGGAGVDRPVLSVAQGAKPHVDVGEPISGPADAKKAVLARAADLEACYAEALKRDPGIDGVLVADLGGQRPAISADSVGDADLAACVAKALVPLAPAQGGKVAVPIRFELDPPGTVRAKPIP